MATLNIHGTTRMPLQTIVRSISTGTTKDLPISLVVHIYSLAALDRIAYSQKGSLFLSILTNYALAPIFLCVLTDHSQAYRKLTIPTDTIVAPVHFVYPPPCHNPELGASDKERPFS